MPPGKFNSLLQPGSLLLLVLAIAPGEALAQRPNRDEPIRSNRVEVYKTVGDVRLKIHVFEPEDHPPGSARPAIVFFFGGGWTNGSPKQFEQQCRYLASRGMVALSAEYRIKSKHDTQIREAVQDGRSAIRWARANAARLGIDPQRLAAGGGSAGGHVAAATATIDLDEPGEDHAVSAVPDALVLFNPAMALAPIDGEEVSERLRTLVDRERAGAEPESLSPAHHIRSGLPPTIMFFGTDDFLLSFAEAYDRKAREAGNSCELRLYEGYSHGFFNFGRHKQEPFLETVAAMDGFLTKLGWLEGTGDVRAWLAAQ